MVVGWEVVVAVAVGACLPQQTGPVLGSNIMLISSFGWQIQSSGRKSKYSGWFYAPNPLSIFKQFYGCLSPSSSAAALLLLTSTRPTIRGYYRGLGSIVSKKRFHSSPNILVECKFHYYSDWKAISKRVFRLPPSPETVLIVRPELFTSNRIILPRTPFFLLVSGNFVTLLRVT